MDEIINKYNIAVPRYTSYPPANYFNENTSAEQFCEVISDSNNDTIQRNISIYIHIPFCRHLCFYCGCNSFSTPKGDGVKRYISALTKEIDMTIAMLDTKRKISQIHFGGGSPTSLDVAVLKEIISKFKTKFEFTEDAEIAIECHPAYLDEKYWTDLALAGFNRISIGIQDFDNNVLSKVNRRPSLIPIEHIFKILRSYGVSINLDFIYGLPHQTPESFVNSMTKAIELSPDRIVTFSYAHVPWVNPMQVKLEKEGLPSTEIKSHIYDSARRLLSTAGYNPIGLDHFVKEDDELYRALNSGQLHRNFQGYCTRHTTGQVYAFGVTAISQLTSAYIQNVKSVEEYVNLIEKGSVAYLKGYLLSHDEQIVGDSIATLMCNRRLVWSEIGERFNVSGEYVKNVTSYDEEKFRQFETDGIIKLSSNEISITDFGAMYIRNVAASLDPLMINSNKTFSKSL